MSTFGLIGKNIGYSFSKAHFEAFFEREGLPHRFVNLDLTDISEFPGVISDIPDLKGLSVTIPYKEKIIPFLDELDSDAREIGAVNTVKIHENGKLTGHNTDHSGFAAALAKYRLPKGTKALILGTGGASKAIAFALKDMGIPFRFVSRSGSGELFTYRTLADEDVRTRQLIVNCTPLGTWPDMEAFPDIPYGAVGPGHLFFDLVYNPPVSAFLKKGGEQGAKTESGQAMLESQATHAWDIWQKR